MRIIVLCSTDVFQVDRGRLDNEAGVKNRKYDLSFQLKTVLMAANLYDYTQHGQR